VIPYAGVIVLCTACFVVSGITACWKRHLDDLCFVHTRLPVFCFVPVLSGVGVQSRCQNLSQVVWRREGENESFCVETGSGRAGAFVVCMFMFRLGLSAVVDFALPKSNFPLF
jgi:hypothetical protein